jgi:hypothetical protein
LGGLFGGRPQAIAPPTERVQGILDQIHAEAQPCHLSLLPSGDLLGGEHSLYPSESPAIDRHPNRGHP